MLCFIFDILDVHLQEASERMLFAARDIIHRTPDTKRDPQDVIKELQLRFGLHQHGAHHAGMAA